VQPVAGMPGASGCGPRHEYTFACRPNLGKTYYRCVFDPLTAGLVAGFRVVGLWSLVVGRWSLVVGRWSLVFGLWSLDRA
jgi:hypothetical protein